MFLVVPLQTVYLMVRLDFANFLCQNVYNVQIILDEIKLKDKDGNEVKLKRQGIAWESDKQYKFKNPDEEILGESWEEYLKANAATPRDWIKDLWELDTENPENNGLQNEDLIVWMRTAAFPNFRKLHRIIEQDLPKGNYTLEIDYSK